MSPSNEWSVVQLNCQRDDGTYPAVRIGKDKYTPHWRPSNPHGGYLESGEQGKHARLMAAAPDLLAALEEVVMDIERYCEDHNSDRPTDVTVVLPRLKAAIAKAKGGE
tara:strand:- start:464 stop:787 length:324 start_codon:yes stop_codon:yes gene_type:complete